MNGKDRASGGSDGYYLCAQNKQQHRFCFIKSFYVGSKWFYVWFEDELAVLGKILRMCLFVPYQKTKEP